MATIKQLAKLLGITTQTIRNYESYGIVKTTRDASNFRAFDEESINTLFKCRRLMSMGFSTKQIVEIANGVSYAEGQKMLKAQAEKIEEEIRYLVQKRNSMPPVFSFMRNIRQKVGTCEFGTSPEGYYLPIMHNGIFLLKDEDLPMLERWNDYAFIRYDVKRVKPQVLFDDMPCEESTIEFFVRAVDAEKAGLDTSLARHTKARLCVRAFSVWPAETDVTIHKKFGFAADFIRDKKLKVIDDLSIFMPFWSNQDSGINHSVMEIFFEQNENCPTEIPSNVIR